MPDAFFGKAKTKSYAELPASDSLGSSGSSGSSDSSVAVHLRTQYYQANGLEKNPKSVTTRKVKLNHGCEVTPGALKLLCPDHEKWKQLPIDGPIDSAFSEELLQYLTGIHNSRKTQFFLRGTKGFVPQYGFTASLVEGTSLQQAVKQIETVALEKDGIAYRLVFEGVAIFWGPKGKTKEEERNSNQVFTIDHIDTGQFANAMNFELKFEVARVTGEQTACSKRGCFFNALEPYPASCFQDNNHIKISNDSLTGDGSVDAIMEKTRSNLGKIIQFIQRNPTHFVPPKRGYLPSSQWSHRGLFDSIYGPTQAGFTSRSFENNPNNLTQQHTDLPPISRTIDLDVVGSSAQNLKDGGLDSQRSTAQLQRKAKKHLKKSERRMKAGNMTP